MAYRSPVVKGDAASVFVEDALQFGRVSAAGQREGQQNGGFLRIEIVRRDSAFLMVVAADEDAAFPHTGRPNDGDPLGDEGFHGLGEYAQSPRADAGDDQTGGAQRDGGFARAGFAPVWGYRTSTIGKASID